MDLRQKIVFFRLNVRGRRELKSMELFAEVVEAHVLDQDEVGVWIQPLGGDIENGDFSTAELLKWEYIATATAPVDRGV